MRIDVDLILIFGHRLIAIMLGVIKMDIDMCISSYCKLAPSIFPEENFLSKNKIAKFIKAYRGTARFKATNLEAAVKAIVAPRLHTEDALLENEEAGCRTFVCVTSKNTGKAARLRSYRSSWEPGTGCTIWEAARATSAAPLFFPPIELGSPPRDYVDGGLNYNNPVRVLWDEAKRVWDNPSRKLKCLISIGTGVCAISPTGNSGKEIINHLAAIAVDTQNTADEFLEESKHLEARGEGFTYIRLDVEQGLQDIGLEEWKQFKPLTEATDYYLSTRIDDVNRCVDALLGVDGM